VRDLMQGAYPELIDSASRVARVVKAEEEQFDRVLKIGLVRLNEELQGSFTGEKAFHLYETFGLPLDFMVDAARDAGVKFDEAGFEAARAEEQARARASWKGGSQKSASPAFRELPKTTFLGYKQLTVPNAEVLAIVKDGVGVPAAAAGDAVDVVLDQTSFYSDSGGQTGDTGVFTSPDHRRDRRLRSSRARRSRPQGHPQATTRRRRPRPHGGRWRPPRCNSPQPHRDAPAARGVATSFRHTRQAGRLVG
jgi:alanyl-tRNA synthetase